MNKSNTLTRDEIQAKYIEWYMDGMTLEDLQELVSRQFAEDLDSLNDKELVNEVKYFAPELLENITLSI